jgi:hypothetical protein
MHSLQGSARGFAAGPAAAAAATPPPRASARAAAHAGGAEWQSQPSSNSCRRQLLSCPIAGSRAAAARQRLAQPPRRPRGPAPPRSTPSPEPPSSGGSSSTSAGGPLLTVGAASAQGPRPSMEDAVRIEASGLPGGFTYAAVFDGHGGGLSSLWLQEYLFPAVAACVDAAWSTAGGAPGDAEDDASLLRPGSAAEGGSGSGGEDWRAPAGLVDKDMVPGLRWPAAPRAALTEVFREVDGRLIEHLKGGCVVAVVGSGPGMPRRRPRLVRSRARRAEEGGGQAGAAACLPWPPPPPRPPPPPPGPRRPLAPLAPPSPSGIRHRGDGRLGVNGPRRTAPPQPRHLRVAGRLPRGRVPRRRRGARDAAAPGVRLRHGRIGGCGGTAGAGTARISHGTATPSLWLPWNAFSAHAPPTHPAAASARPALPQPPPPELERVESTGAWVVDGRVCNVLAVSRAFGDPEFKVGGAARGWGGPGGGSRGPWGQRHCVRLQPRPQMVLAPHSPRPTRALCTAHASRPAHPRSHPQPPHTPRVQGDGLRVLLREGANKGMWPQR